MLNGARRLRARPRDPPPPSHLLYSPFKLCYENCAAGGAVKTSPLPLPGLMIAAVTITTAGQFVHLQQHADGH